MKKNVIKKIFMIIIIISLVFVFSVKEKSNLSEVMLKGSTKVFAPLQYELSNDIDIQDGLGKNYISMSSLYSISGDVVTPRGIEVAANKIILISTATDLYAFSKLANVNDSAFLTYHYELSSNIDYSTCNYSFVPIAWDPNNNDSFTGVFDGNGFEIINLSLPKIVDGSGREYEASAIYERMIYYSMFSYNDGLITNLGLVNASLLVNTSSIPDMNVAPLVGINRGQSNDRSKGVINCYVKDLRNPDIDDETGIITAGGFTISGLMSVNDGDFYDCYSAYSTLVNYSIIDYISFSEIIDTKFENSRMSNIYFYNASIEDITTSGNKYRINYERIEDTVERNNNGEICVLSLNSLNELVSNSELNGFYENSYYDGVSSRLRMHFEFDTPFGRVLEYTTTDDVTTFRLTSLIDFIYAFELMRSNSLFASNACKYELNTDLDLSIVPSELYEYNGIFNSTFYGVLTNAASKTITVTDVLGNSSLYPTIYNAKIDNTIITDGIECYGLFPWLGGEIKNVNLYYSDTIDYIRYTDNISKKAIGLVSGFVDGGKITNVNVYGNVNISNNIGRYMMGGICGILSSKGIIAFATMAGSINGGVQDTFAINADFGFLSGNCLGGITGFESYDSGGMMRVLNGANITSSVFTSSSSIKQHIGGVLGAGYTHRVTDSNVVNGISYIADDLTNKGNITIGSAANNNIGSTYTGGVIGKLLGINNQIEMIYNQGNISYYSNNIKSYISGVVNVELMTSNGSSSALENLQISSLKNSSGKVCFLLTNSSNGGTFNIKGVNDNNMICGNVNIITSVNNEFLSEIEGIYTLPYKYNIVNSVNEKTPLSSQTFEMNAVKKYSPCINSTSFSNFSSVKLEKIYNLRDINFTTTEDITSSPNNELLYSGCVLGKFIDYLDVRNEGDISLASTNAVGLNYRKITARLVGLFEELTAGYKASNVFNGGDLSMSTTVDYYGDVIISGICTYNNNGFSDLELESYSPMSENFDSSSTGSINNAINNGNITCTSPSFENLTYNHNDVLSQNGYQTIYTNWEIINNTASYYGNVNLSGIVYINKSVITNTFNLGDVFAANYINSGQNLEINASGISTFNIGKASYILNSANNGTIKAINLSKIATSNVNASGISVRNDKLDNGSQYSGSLSDSHSKQIISFTINYGSVYSYNFVPNINSSALETKAKSAGILAMGLCNVINTVNYGNIYGSEASSGIFGIVYFSLFSSEVSASNKVHICNSINYGNVRVLEKGINYFRNNETEYPSDIIRYNKFRSLNDNDSDILDYAKLEILSEENRLFFIGAIFALVNFNNDINATNVFIRYIINFLEDVKIVGNEPATPNGVDIDRTNIFSAYAKYENNMMNYDSYMNDSVVYSPLSTGKTVVSGSEFDGVFSTDFAFRKAIEEGVGINPSIETDRFITDFFQFVGYTKINDNLLDKIGWRTMAYVSAANDFAMNIESVAKFLNSYKTVDTEGYELIKEEALDTSLWVQKCDSSVLSSLIHKLIEDKSITELEDLIEYLFSPLCENSRYIDNTVKSDIIDLLLTYDENIIGSNLVVFVDGYSSLLASLIVNSDSNLVKEYILEYLSTISFSRQKEILSSYVSVLKLNDAYYSNTSSSDRYMLLNKMLDGINDEDFYEEIISRLSSSNQTIVNTIGSSLAIASIKEYAAYQGMSQEEKVLFYQNIFKYNNETKIDEFLDVMINDISFYVYLKARGYDISSLSDIDVKANLTSATKTNPNDLEKIERISLYNAIRNTTTFATYLESRMMAVSGSSKYYALATEVRNTYQSLSAPANNGTYSGDNIYVYDSNITPSTYFYGPYADSNGTKLTSFTVPHPNNPSSNVTTAISQSVTSWTTDNLGQSNRKYQSIFIVNSYDDIPDNLYDKLNIDETLREKQDINTNQTKNRAFFYEYGWEGANNQLCGDLQFTRDGVDKIYGISAYGSGKTDFSGTLLGQSDELINYNNEGYDARGAKLSGFSGNRTTGTFTIKDKNNVTHSYTTSLSEWRRILLTYAVEYFIFVPKTSYHETQYTGIYIYAEPWDGYTPYYTRKQSSATPVFTTQYIDYSTSDLVKLDGMLTGYTVEERTSSDERNIINDLFNRFLVTDNNFVNVVKKCLLESLMLHENGNVNEEFIDMFVKTNLETDKQVSSSAPFNYLNETASSSVKAYLSSLTTSFNNKTKLLMTSSVNNAVAGDVIEKLLFTEYTTVGEITDFDYQKYVENGVVDTYDTEINSSTSGVHLKYYLKSGTYNSISYLGGLTFRRLTVNVPSDAKTLNIIAASSNTSSLLKISNQNLNITSINKYTFDISGVNSTSFILESSEDVVIYDISYDIDVEDGTDVLVTERTGSQNYTNTPTGTRPTSTQIPTEANFINQIPNNASLTDLSITSITASATLNRRNNSYKAYRHIVVYNTSGQTSFNTTNSSVYILRDSNTNTNNSSNTINNIIIKDELTSRYGNTIYATYSSANAATTVNVSGNYSYFSNLTYTINYSYNDVEIIQLYRTDNISVLQNSEIVTANGSNVFLSSILSPYIGYYYNNYVDQNSIALDSLMLVLPLETVPLQNEVNTLFNSEEFNNILIYSSNEKILEMINEIDDVNALKDVLDLFINHDKKFFTSIIEYFGLLNISDSIKEELICLLLTTDYKNIYEVSLDSESITIASTKYSDLLSSFNAAYDYIENDGSINNDKFDAFLEEIGVSLATSGYGIYALASSKGILNGEFIPDNLPLSQMDTCYQSNNGYFELIEEDSSSWRGGTSSENCEVGSVSEGFLREMKQLKLSISTTVFELDLIYNGNIIKSSNELIDLSNSVITYYVPSAFLGCDFTYHSSFLANGATIESLDFTAKARSDESLGDSIVVVAEDTTVTKEYTIKVIALDMDYNFSLADVSGVTTVASEGGSLTLMITPYSPLLKLPEGFDLSPYIQIVDLSNNVIENSFTIISNALVDDEGNANIIINVSSELKGGSYYVVVSLFDILTKSDDFTKELSDECDIVAMEYNGSEVVFNMNNATSYVKFSRLYTKEELEDLSYLTYIKFSECATSLVNASYSIDSGTNLITYTVHFTVTAENGSYKEYNHFIIEETPVKTPTVYHNGYLLNNVVSGNLVSIDFNRGLEPTYRIKYDLNNFYEGHTNATYDYMINGSYDYKNEAIVGLDVDSSYASLNVTIDHLAEPDEYTFNYVYKDTFEFDGAVSREYIYPLITIRKNFSIDSKLSRIAFLDEDLALSSLSIVMNPNHAIILSEASDEFSDPLESDYYDLRNADNQDISVEVKNVHYDANNVDYSNETNYYVIGSISNAELSDYAPILKIEEHAELYQYTTQKKLTGYGLNQTSSDTSILNTNRTGEALYLYVLFESVENDTTVYTTFIIKSLNGVWSDVYLNSFSGNEEKVATYNSETKSFVYDSKTYTKSVYAGTADVINNKALYMDYIGSPLDNHFWYVSYVVFSEDYLYNNQLGTNEHLQFFHISIIDSTNTVYFDVTIDAPSTLENEEIYLSIVDRRYDIATSSYIGSCDISAFTTYDSLGGSGNHILTTTFQPMPRGYFYFYLNLSNGYSATFEITNNRPNTNSLAAEEGAYLPPNSIVMQRVMLHITITENAVDKPWGVNIAESYTIMVSENN